MVTDPDTLTRRPTMTETQLMEAVRDMAAWLGYLFYHPWTSINSNAGWPDVVLLRLAVVDVPARLIIVELKNATRKPTDAQRAWLDGLSRVAGVEVALWRPADWLDGTIERVLSGQERAVWSGEDGDATHSKAKRHQNVV